MKNPEATPLVIIGASGHARVATDVATRRGFDVVGYVDDFAEKGGRFLDKPLLGGRNELFSVRDDDIRSAFVAIGSANARKEFARLLEQAGLQSPLLTHPSAIIAPTSSIGPGTLVAAGAIVNPNASVGTFCILNTGSIVEHDCRIGSYAHICPGASLAGGVVVEEGAWVGIGSTVIGNVSIGKFAVVGAGAVVTRDVEAGSTVVGVPARSIHVRA